MKLTKTFKGVPNGAIYPVAYKPDDECPPELEAAALELGVLEAAAPAPTLAPTPSASTQADDLLGGPPATQEAPQPESKTKPKAKP